MAIALINSATAGGINGAVTSGIITTGATLLVLVVTYYAAPTVSDSSSGTNTFTALTQYASGEAKVRLYYCVNPGYTTAGATHTFTLSGSGTYSYVSAFAFSGTGAYDANANGNTGASGSSLTTGSITPSEAGCLLIAGVSTGAGTSGTYSIDNGFSAPIGNVWTNNVHEGNGASYLVHTSGAMNPAFSWTGSGVCCAAIAAFKAAAAGGGSILLPMMQHGLYVR